MPYKYCRPPETDYHLAKGNANKNAPHYNTWMTGEMEYWQALGGRVLPLTHEGEWGVADVLLTRLSSTPLALIREEGVPEPNLQRAEFFNRSLLSLIALSQLCRDLIPGIIPHEQAGRRSPAAAGSAEPNTTQEVQWATVLPEPPQMTEDGKSLDSRLHLPPRLADDLLGPQPRKRWYRREDRSLYVRRPGQPAKPSTVFMEDMMTQNIAAPFDGLETVFPYLPAVSGFTN